jgi:hypothetical protein
VKENENARADNPGSGKMDTEISHRAVDKREKSTGQEGARTMVVPSGFKQDAEKTIAEDAQELVRLQV